MPRFTLPSTEDPELMAELSAAGGPEASPVGPGPDPGGALEPTEQIRSLATQMQDLTAQILELLGPSEMEVPVE
jgi:hypothetical protein